jgi:hypothetical protein
MNNDKELQKLIEQMFSKEQAQEFKENLQKTERRFDKSPAPEPDREFTDKLKAEVTSRLKRKKSRKMRRVILRLGSTAAAVILFAIILINFPQAPHEQPRLDASKESSSNLLSDKIWDSSDLSEDDPELSRLSLELREVQSEFTTDNIEEKINNSSYQQELSQIEVTYLEIDNQFWKGP